MTDTRYILANHLGGITSVCSNLIRYRPESAGVQTVILLTNVLDPTPKVKGPLGGDEEIVFNYSTQENFYCVLGRLARLVAPGTGPVVSNGEEELALFSRYNLGKTVFQIVHDAYNLRLAQRFEPVVDVMIAHSKYFFEQLQEKLPHRRESIFYLPYGIPIGCRIRQRNETGLLHLVFLGRLHNGKGVHDLPKIDRMLQSASVFVRWTIIGDGPERQRLMDSFPASERVRYASPQSSDDVLSLCAEGDVFVFPTHFEGFPVALLEAMSTGLVPVASDLPSGIPEVVDASSGFRVAIGDITGFAERIAMLHYDRPLLERLSLAARERAQAFDVTKRVGKYHRLFARWEELKRPWPGPLTMKLGSRLDQPYLPNAVTLASRRVFGQVSVVLRRRRA